MTRSVSLSVFPDVSRPSVSASPEDRAVNNPLPDRGGNGLALGEDRFKPVVPWPHVEGVEVDLESIRRKNKAGPEQERRAGGGDNQRDVMQRQYLTFKPQTLTYRDPVLRPGVLEFKHAVQASIKEFGFNMVASDMISLDRSVNDLRQEEAALLSPYWLRTEDTQRVRITHALPPAHPPRSPRGLVWCHGISAAVAHGPCRPCSLPSVTRINEPPARLRNPASGCLSAVTSDTVANSDLTGLHTYSLYKNMIFFTVQQMLSVSNKQGTALALPSGALGLPREEGKGEDVSWEEAAHVEEVAVSVDSEESRCKYWHYDENLLTASVVIVFHNEGWSTLMRTVHSVIKRTPRKYLAEIVLIDDFSNKEHLKGKLDEYIKLWNGLVKVFRNERREGLIQARSIGAQKAKLGQVLIYLDAHCEVAANWYAPLVAPISKDSASGCVLSVTFQLVVIPGVADYIDGNDYSIEPQQGGDEDGFARGAWDWSLLWKRIPLSHKEKAKRKHKTEPYRSPAMAGGLFAIERDFFFELGLYDPGLQIWGGENFEISYKIWQCGGKLLFVPCSRVGHIYRLEGWQGNPPPIYVGSSPTLKNYVRVVEVWWDEYKDYFYASRPESKALAYGDISELKKFREDHNCKSFKWFMEEIAYDVTSHYPLPPRNVEWGEIRGFETAYCIDSMGRTNGGLVELGPCHRMGGNQLFRINEANQLMQYDQCLTKGPDGSKIMITHCNLNEFKEWQYFKNLHRLTHVPSGMCLDRSEILHQVFISNCDSSKTTQKWEINNIHSV
ncbi:N-acetylgalactosaminyltransferase 7 isoform 2 [Camelus ferus]|nr:N-acetylgalactosaminyltransferase 7 isoform 2 [Camelus ferus]